MDRLSQATTNRFASVGELNSAIDLIGHQQVCLTPILQRVFTLVK
jgi:hypothetical protein